MYSKMERDLERWERLADELSCDVEKQDDYILEEPSEFLEFMQADYSAAVQEYVRLFTDEEPDFTEDDILDDPSEFLFFMRVHYPFAVNDFIVSHIDDLKIWVMENSEEVY